MKCFLILQTALFLIYILFYCSLSNQEPVKRARNRNVQRSSSEDTDTNGKKYETRNKLSFNKYLRNFKMSSTVVDSYSSMESPVFSIPQHRKIRRGLSDIDPKYVSQVRHFSILYSLFGASIEISRATYTTIDVSFIEQNIFLNNLKYQNAYSSSSSGWMERILLQI